MRIPFPPTGAPPVPSGRRARRGPRWSPCRCAAQSVVPTRRPSRAAAASLVGLGRREAQRRPDRSAGTLRPATASSPCLTEQLSAPGSPRRARVRPMRVSAEHRIGGDPSRAEAAAGGTSSQWLVVKRSIPSSRRRYRPKVRNLTGRRTLMPARISSSAGRRVEPLDLEPGEVHIGPAVACSGSPASRATRRLSCSAA